MLGCEAVGDQAVVAAIRFGDREPDAVARLHVERFGHGAEQGGPCTEGDQALSESSQRVRLEPMFLVNASRVGLESAGN